MFVDANGESVVFVCYDGRGHTIVNPIETALIDALTTTNPHEQPPRSDDGLGKTLGEQPASTASSSVTLLPTTRMCRYRCTRAPSIPMEMMPDGVCRNSRGFDTVCCGNFRDYVTNIGVSRRVTGVLLHYSGKDSQQTL